MAFSSWNSFSSMIGKVNSSSVIATSSISAPSNVNFSYTIGSPTASISFTTSAGATSYYANVNGINLSTSAGSPITIAVDSNRIYRVFVVASNTSGSSSFSSNYVSFTTNSVTGSTLPSRPSSVSYSYTNGSSNASISFSSVSGATMYYAYVDGAILGQSATSPIIIPVIQYASYGVYVVASNSTGFSNSDYSANFNTGEITGLVATNPPTNVSYIYNSGWQTAAITFTPNTLGARHTLRVNNVDNVSGYSSPLFIDVTSNITYTVYVRATNNRSTSSNSLNNATFTTGQIQTSSPSPPTNVSYIYNSGSPYASITFSTIAGATYYNAVVNYQTVAISSTSPLIINVSTYTSYTVYVSATNSFGTSSQSSSSANFTTGIIVPIPSPPTNVSYSYSNGLYAQINFTTSSGATNYYAVVNGNIIASSNNSPIYMSVYSNTSYIVYVTASNSSGTSANSTTYASFTTGTVYGPASQPTITTTSVGTTSVTLNWNPSYGTTPITYNVSISTINYNNSTSNTNITIGGLSSRTSYTVQISAYNSTYGSSSPTNYTFATN